MSCDRIPCLPNENDRQVSIPESEYNRLKQIEAAYFERLKMIDGFFKM